MEARVDLRSDTVTLPSPEMRRAIHDAEVGDDVYGDDPTVNELEDKAAEMLGKEAGLFVTSGTQGNLVSMLAHCGRGDEVLVGDRSHIFSSEAGGASVLGGIFLYPIRTDRYGFLEPDVIRAATKPHDYHVPPTKLLCIENTHNQMSGQPLTTAQTQAMADAGREGGMSIHIDGARIFNAAVSLGVDVAELAAPADSATFCLSKGLSCPIGSVVVGSSDFIARARRWRKMLGAGMRQVGVIAAAGIYSLDNMIERLEEDHVNAKKLAEGLAEIDGISVDPDNIHSNIVFFSIPPGSAAAISANLKERGILVNPGDPMMRMVTHYGISSEDIDYTLVAIQEHFQQAVAAA